MLRRLEVDERAADHPIPVGKVLGVGATVDLVEGKHMAHIAPESLVPQNPGDVAVPGKEGEPPVIVEPWSRGAQPGVGGVGIPDEFGVVGVEAAHGADTTSPRRRGARCGGS